MEVFKNKSSTWINFMAAYIFSKSYISTMLQAGAKMKKKSILPASAKPFDL